MKTLMTNFNKLEREIAAISWLVIILLGILLGYLTWLISHSKIEDAFKLSGATVTLLSVLLVSKTASRVLIHNDISKTDLRRQNIVRITHHFITVINDLINRVHHASITIREGKRPIVALTKNAAMIEKRFELFYDKELYLYLNPESISIIEKMSGSIHGFCTFAEGVADQCKPNSMIPDADSCGNQKMADSLDKLIEDLKALDEQVRHLRGSVQPV